MISIENHYISFSKLIDAQQLQLKANLESFSGEFEHLFYPPHNYRHGD